MIAGQAVDDQIVDDAARRPAGHGVQRPSVGQLADVVGDQALHRLGGARALEVHLAHVADVEHTDGAARGAVLVDDAGRIVDRHPPAAEVDHAGAQTLVRLRQRRLLRCGVGRGWGTRPDGGLRVSGLGRHRADILRETPAEFKAPAPSFSEGASAFDFRRRCRQCAAVVRVRAGFRTGVWGRRSSSVASCRRACSDSDSGSWRMARVASRCSFAARASPSASAT